MKKQIDLRASPVTDEQLTVLADGLEKEMQRAAKAKDEALLQESFVLKLVIAELQDLRESFKLVGNPKGLNSDLLPAIKFLLKALPHFGPIPGVENQVVKDKDGKILQADWGAKQKCGHCDLLQAVAAAQIKLKDVGKPPEYLQGAFVPVN